MLTSKGLNSEIVALRALLTEERNAVSLAMIHRKAISLAQTLEDGIARSRPMLLLTFDDAEGAPAFICNPALHLRFGEELERCRWIGEGDLEIPQLRRVLGAETAAYCAAMFTLSHALRDAGLGSLVEFRETHPDDLEDLLGARTAPAPEAGM